MGPVPKEDTTQVPTELMFEAFINSKRIKPVLKREVNNETFFTWLRSCYQINHYYGLLYTVYIGVRVGGRLPPRVWKISGQALVARKFWMIKKYFNTVKNSWATLFFRASASCSKILNDKKYIFNTVKNSRITMFFKASASSSTTLNVKGIFNTVKNSRVTVFQGKRKLLKNLEW